MIKKIFITTFLLILFYNVFVSRLAPLWWHASQHHWQDNMARAQEFLYAENEPYKYVIVGSSLSRRLIADSLPETYNISFSGQCGFDGMNILTGKSTLPQNILIEMNILLQKENTEFAAALNSPIMSHARRILPCLREDRQPLSILGILPFLLFKNDKASFFKEKEEVFQANANTDELFKLSLATEVKKYAITPRQGLVDSSMRKMEHYVREFENKGVNVIFFEMPVNPLLENLPMAKNIRESFYKHFPTTKYRYIQLPEHIKFKTTDGTHLGREEAQKYTNYFKIKLE